MKKSLLFLAIMAMALCYSCGNKEKIKWASGEEKETRQVDKILVPFTRTESNLISLQASLNGVPFNMIYDTGASGSTISVLELQQLKKEGKFNEDDFVGLTLAMLADGSLMIGERITIKEIWIQGQGNVTLRVPDVEVTVVDDENASMLMGQDIIGQLPKHSINDVTGMIEFDKE